MELPKISQETLNSDVLINRAEQLTLERLRGGSPDV